VDTQGVTDRSDSITGGISRRAALSRFATAGAAVALMAANQRAVVHAQSPQPTGAVGVAPNHFVLEGEETHIVYDTTTDAGTPQLTYQGPYGDQTFNADALTIEDGALGHMVTAYLGAFPDQGDLWMTLLVPEFVPTTVDAEPTPFGTVAILKWLISTIAGPPREGALEEYRVLDLEGTAELVMS
jgi:hypothetical protein